MKQLDIVHQLLCEEMREAFWRIADRLRNSCNKEVHPDEIAEKVFGSAPPWSES
jgi:hypothetical protein